MNPQLATQINQETSTTGVTKKKQKNKILSWAQGIFYCKWKLLESLDAFQKFAHISKKGESKLDVYELLFSFKIQVPCLGTKHGDFQSTVLSGARVNCTFSKEKKAIPKSCLDVKTKHSWENAI